MDQKYKLSKTERQEIVRLLDIFINEDTTIQLEVLQNKIKEEVKDKIQKLYNNVMHITTDIEDWFTKNSYADTHYIYYSNRTYMHKHKYDLSDYKIPNIYNLSDQNIDCVMIKTYTYNTFNRFSDDHYEKVIKCYEEVFDKYFENYKNRLEKFKNIRENMLIVFNSLNTAPKILEKFGFIPSINSYLSNLMNEQAKPISLCTKAVENSVDNYLNSRKSVDE